MVDNDYGWWLIMIIKVLVQSATLSSCLRPNAGLLLSHSDNKPGIAYFPVESDASIGDRCSIREIGIKIYTGRAALQTIFEPMSESSMRQRRKQASTKSGIYMPLILLDLYPDNQF